MNQILSRSLQAQDLEVWKKEWMAAGKFRANLSKQLEHLKKELPNCDNTNVNYTNQLVYTTGFNKSLEIIMKLLLDNSTN